MKTKKQTKKVEKAMIKIKNIKHVDSSCEAGRIITGLEALKERESDFEHVFGYPCPIKRRPFIGRW